MDPVIQDIMDRLAEPFDESEVKFKPAVVSGSRALALCYVDARCIQDRLDEVLGVTGWQDEYECLPDGNVVCKLRLKIGGEWIQKMDVGGPSEQPDEGDRRKASFSDALKRAAVKFGIGRYLYRAEQQWVDYDPQKKKFARQPKLPAVVASAKPLPKVAAEAKAPKAAPKPTAPGLPTNGEAFMKWLGNMDHFGADKGWFDRDDLENHIKAYAVKEGWRPAPQEWELDQVVEAIAVTRDFMERHEKLHKAKKKPVPEVA